MQTPKTYPGEIAFSNFRPHQIYEVKLKFFSQHSETPERNPQYTFQPIQTSPHEINFTDFKPYNIYEAQLTVFCNDSSSHSVELLAPDSDYFDVVEPRYQKVYPGSAIKYKLIFKPKEKKSYTCSLICVTDSGRFQIPVTAFRVPPILDLPSEIHFKNGIVKRVSQHSILVQNNGRNEAIYQLCTHGPFSVDNREGTLKVGESKMLTVDFLPKNVGEYEGDLLVHYKRTGENVSIKLYGSASELDVQMSEDFLMITENIFSTRRCINIDNKSDTTLRYKWRRFSNKDEVEALRDDEGVTVSPETGDIMPGGKVHVTVTVTPQKCKRFKQALCLDIEGKEALLPLQICLEGLRPQLELSYDVLTVGNVFLNAKERYELTVCNHGLTEAHFRVVPFISSGTQSFEVSPSEGVVVPCQEQVIVVTFGAETLGSFQEKFLFEVEGMQHTPCVTFRGCVMENPFSIDIPELDFGVVCEGCPKVLTFNLSNTSVVPVNYGIRLLSSAHTQSLRGEQKQEEDLFTMTPSAGTLNARETYEVMVTLCSSAVQEYNEMIVVDAGHLGKQVASLYVKAKCISPNVQLSRTEVEFTAFVKQLHKDYVTLINNSDVSMRYKVIPQEENGRLTLQYSSPDPEGLIEPNSEVTITLDLMAHVIGKLEADIHISLYGDRKCLKLNVFCTSKGPNIQLDPCMLDFGTIVSVTECSRHVYFWNLSPIEAHFQAYMAKGIPQFSVEPNVGVIPADGMIEFKVEAYLNDASLFKDTLNVEIQHDRVYSIPVTAKGSGTTIISNVPLGPTLDLGTHLRSSICEYKFRLTNKGLNRHRLVWSTEGSFDSKTLKKEKPRINVEPTRVVLDPGQRVDMVLTCSSKSSKVVKETIVCKAIIGSETSIKQIMLVDVTCRFADPELFIPEKKLSFYLEKPQTPTLTSVYKSLTIINVSPVDFNVEVMAPEHFTLCEAQMDGSSTGVKSKRLVCNSRRDVTVDVRFELSDVAYTVQCPVKDLLQIRCLDFNASWSVELTGEVAFPHISLSKTSLEFGNTYIYTSATQSITIINTSLGPIFYNWRFKDEENNMFAGVTDASDPRIKDASDIHEKIFEISPNRGMLYPGESQEVGMTFHAWSKNLSKAVALCQVVDGITYEVSLSGTASDISYALSRKEIDLGMTWFDYVAKEDILLQNTGLVGFDYRVLLYLQDLKPHEVMPEVPLVVPSEGHIQAMGEETLSVYYLPGSLEFFTRHFILSIADFKQEEITITGKGVTPSIWLDLAENLEEDDMLSEAAFAALKIRRESKVNMWRYMEMQRNLLSEKITSEREYESPSGSRWKLDRIELPGFLLDFGYVIPGNVPTRTVTVVNTGDMNVCFKLNTTQATESGFSFGLQRVRNLKPLQSQTFDITFDPVAAKLEAGKINIVMRIKLDKGPTVPVRLRATVVMPSLTINTSSVQFGHVRYGQCKVVTIQLCNPEPVPCKWSVTGRKPQMKFDKYMPLHVKRKFFEKQRIAQKVFEVLPSSGTLQPKKKVHVYILFTPLATNDYEKCLLFSVAQSTQRLQLELKGKGKMQELEFSCTDLNFAPTLPGDCSEVEVNVHNPCNFPIEVFCLEFDKQHVEENKVFQAMKGMKNLVLLPRRKIGEALPKELLNYIHHHEKEEHGAKHQGILSSSLFAKDPVYRAIAQYMGMIIPLEVSKGIGIIVHGAPLSAEKTKTARLLAKHYGTACLSINSVVEETISTGTGLATYRAQQLCKGTVQEETGVDAAESPSESDTYADSNEGPHNPENLEIESAVLPEDVLLEMLSDRFRCEDCIQGVVIDGLDSNYCYSMESALLTILKALGNRRFIYVLDMYSSTDNKTEEPGDVKSKVEAAQTDSAASDEKMCANIALILSTWDRSGGEVPKPPVNKLTQAVPDKMGVKSESIEDKPVVGVPRIDMNEDKSKSLAHLLDLGELPPLEEVLKEAGVESHTIPRPTTFTLLNVSEEQTKPNVLDVFSVGTTTIDRGLEQGTVTLSVKDLPTKIRVKTPPKKLGKDVSPSLTGTTETETQVSEKKKKRSPTNLRWIIPAGGKVTQKLLFCSATSGVFEQTMNFSLVACDIHYQLYCKAACGYPSIVVDPEIVFSNCKTAKQPLDYLEKTYILQTNTYQFGPLFCGKTREGWKTNKFVMRRHMERLVIQNNSPHTSEIDISFQKDNKGTNFILDPPSMTLLPNETKELRVWAFPTIPEFREDAVVCEIKDNPEPTIFKISCFGVWPDLEISTKRLNFGRCLVNRTVTRQVILKSKCLLPLAWRLSEMDEMFTVSQETGILPALYEHKVDINCRATKAVDLKTKIRIVVMDPDNVLGVVSTDDIMITGEVCDICIDIKVAKGSRMDDVPLDFGTILVSEESTLPLVLINKGKHDVGFRFIVDSTVPSLASSITIKPEAGTIHHGAPAKVHATFCSLKEVSIKGHELISLQLIDLNSSEKDDIVGNVPIGVFLEALSSKYTIDPAGELNFGIVPFGTRASRKFKVTNTGELDWNFYLHSESSEKMVPAPKMRAMSRKISAIPIKVMKKDNLVLDLFCVRPTGNLVQSGETVEIIVEFQAERLGICDVTFLVDIEKRDDTDNPAGIPFRLLAEVCLPEIQVDPKSIFKEHPFCSSKSLPGSKPQKGAVGFYVDDQNKFVFSNVVVGHTAVAKFSFNNSGKLPYSLSLALRTPSVHKKGAKVKLDIFTITPDKLCIPSGSQAFASVSFTPTATDTYNTVFEATVDNAQSSQSPEKGKHISFEVTGEGVMPQVDVLHPQAKDRKGNLMLNFKPVLAGCSQSLPLVLQNNSVVPIEVNATIEGNKKPFSVTATPNTIPEASDAEAPSEVNMPMVLDVEQQGSFEVKFQPVQKGTYQATLNVQVADNLRAAVRTITVKLSGEGLAEIVTLQDINDPDVTTDVSEVLNFGECVLGWHYTKTFSMTNHSETEVLHFEWPEKSFGLMFTPQEGLIHPGCTKAVTVTFHAEEPLELCSHIVKCRVRNVEFMQPVEAMADWDDKPRTQTVYSRKQHSYVKKKTELSEIEFMPVGSGWEIDLCVSADCHSDTQG